MLICLSQLFSLSSLLGHLPNNPHEDPGYAISLGGFPSGWGCFGLKNTKGDTFQVTQVHLVYAFVSGS